MTSYRVLECAGCGVVVADFGQWRVNWLNGEAHSCAIPVDALDTITAVALAGDAVLDDMVADVAAEWLTGGK